MAVASAVTLDHRTMAIQTTAVRPSTSQIALVYHSTTKTKRHENDTVKRYGKRFHE